MRSISAEHCFVISFTTIRSGYKHARQKPFFDFEIRMHHPVQSHSQGLLILRQHKQRGKTLPMSLGVAFGMLLLHLRNVFVSRDPPQFQCYMSVRWSLVFCRAFKWQTLADVGLQCFGRQIFDRQFRQFRPSGD